MEVTNIVYSFEDLGHGKRLHKISWVNPPDPEFRYCSCSMRNNNGMQSPPAGGRLWFDVVRHYDTNGNYVGDNYIKFSDWYFFDNGIQLTYDFMLIQTIIGSKVSPGVKFFIPKY
jgi:hypothetical protein